jgi:membrane fusion protein (multidrug efflux system)
MLIMLALLLVVVLCVGFFKYQGYKGFMAMKAGMAAAKQTVASAKATLEPWQDSENAVGTLRAAKGVDISNELAGMVEDIRFHSGNDVKAGAVLITLKAEDDIAKLHSLEANEKIASITYERDKKQLKAQAIARATFDNDTANLASAKALVAQQKALVDKKFIRAPFAGHLGIRNIDQGQYLQPGTAIVTLQALDPIYLDFYLPQQSLSTIKVGQKITAKTDTYPDRNFSGSIAAINPKVDIATRNVMVRAAIKNSDHALLPGMYATGAITVGEPKQFVTVPQTAISYNPYGNTVFILKDHVEKKEPEGDADKDGKKDAKEEKPAEAPKQEATPANGEKPLYAEQSFVKVGATRGDQIQILEGVKEGDEIVIAGQLKLQNGSAVIVNNSVLPKNDANPNIEDK